MNNSFSWKQDIPASLVVFFVALPLCLGIAVVSDAPNVFAGLIAGIIGGIVVAALSGSRLGVSGPAAGLAVIVATAIGEIGYSAFMGCRLSRCSSACLRVSQNGCYRLFLS